MDAGKWMELKIIILSGINLAQKAKYHIISSYVESWCNKKIAAIIMWHEYKRYC
jgi:hypothetical protein